MALQGEPARRLSRSASRATLRSRRRTLADDDIVSQHESLFGGSRRPSSHFGEDGSHPGDPKATEKSTVDNEAVLSSRTYINNSFHHFRFVVVMFGGLLFGNIILVRYSICIAMLRMVNQTAISIQTSNLTELHKDPDEYDGEFVWDNRIQQLIMSIYMVAYTLPQIPATKLGLMMGPRWSIALACLLCNLSTILIPPAAYMGWQWVIVLRLVNGLAATPIQSMIIEMIEKWMPYHQLTLGLTCAQTVTSSLTTINPLLTGYLASIHWTYAFYIPSAVGLLLSVLFLFVVSDRPETNWLISEKELRTIKSNACTPDDSVEKSQSNEDKKGSVAVEFIEESRPNVTLIDVIKLPTFYAYLFIWILYCSSYTGFNFILPRYLQDMLMISVGQIGLTCFIIQIGHPISQTWPHFTVAFLERKCGLSKTVAGRICYGVTCVFVAVTWFSIGRYHDWQTALLLVNRCFHGSNVIFITGSVMGNFAKVGLSSITYSLLNMVGNLSTVGTSTLIGYALDQTGQSQACWTYVFYGLACTQAIAFTLFATLVRPGPITFRNKSTASS